MPSGCHGGRVSSILVKPLRFSSDNLGGMAQQTEALAFVRRATQILALPLLEAVLFGAATELIVPGVAAWVMFQALLEKETPLSLSLRVRGLGIHLGFFALCLAITYLAPRTSTSYMLFSSTPLIPALRAGLLFSGLFLFVSPDDIESRCKAFPWSWLIALGAAASLEIHRAVNETISPILIPPVAVFVTGLSPLFGLPAKLTSDHLSSTIETQLASGKWAIQIYAPCSGFEGVMLFCFILAIRTLMRWDDYASRRTLRLLALGSGLMLGLNAVRILVFFLFGAVAHRFLGPGAATDLVTWLFHESLGSILYLIGIALFFRWETRQRPSALPVVAP